MSAMNSTEAASSKITQQEVAQQFVRLYYGILNRHHEHLYQFYGKDSTVTVSETMEGGETAVEAAEDESAIKELLNTLYSDVRIRVISVVPQFSVDDSVLLHVNGTMERKSKESHRAFAQAFVLFPQENGYYIRTDIAHVMGPNCVHALGEQYFKKTNTLWPQGEKSLEEHDRSILGESNGNQKIMLRLGSYEGEIPDERNGKGMEIRTSTPPLEDAPLTQAKFQGSDHDSDEGISHKEQKKSEPWIVRPPVASSSICHSVMAQPSMTLHPVQPTMTLPPLPVGPGAMSGLMYPVAAIPQAPPPPPAGSRYLRQRSASMGCDPWAVHRAMGHGVFIARLPFGIQPIDVEQAFASFGPIQGGREGIQVRDGRNGCYAFVTFENPESAQAAIQEGAIIQGKRVFVEPRYPRQEPETHFLSFSSMIPTGAMPPPPPPPYHLNQVSTQVPRMPR